jgi:hypothetical protein
MPVVVPAVVPLVPPNKANVSSLHGAAFLTEPTRRMQVPGPSGDTAAYTRHHPTPIRAWAHTRTGAMTAWCQARAIATDDAPVDVVLLLVDLGFGWKRKSNNSAPCAVRTASLFRSPAMAYAVLPSVYSRKRGPPRRPASILGRSNRGPGAGGSDFSLAARFFHGRCVWPAACFIVLSPRTLRGRRRRAPGAPSWASGRSPGTSLTARPESRPRGVAAHQRPRTACPVRPTGSMLAR